jgi:hypothetical protein
MARAIIAVIVSYVVIFVLIFLAFTCAYLLMGTNNAFKPGSYQASNRWIAMSFAVSFVVAIIAGLICAAIAKGGKAPLALVIVVLVLGFLTAIFATRAQNARPDMVRMGGVSQMEAMQRAKEPPWVRFTFPLVGAVGILIGGKLKRRS